MIAYDNHSFNMFQPTSSANLRPHPSLQGMNLIKSSSSMAFRCFAIALPRRDDGSAGCLQATDQPAMLLEPCQPSGIWEV